MKTEVKKTEATKVSHPDTSNANETNTRSTIKDARTLKLEKVKLFDRFIEASCDCV